MHVQNTDIAILGGGLSGLAIADLLEAAGADWRLDEARARLGGRILGRAAACYDLGPGWTWPGDRRVSALAQRLGVLIFPQYATGRLVFQDEGGAVRRDLDMALMAGARRVAGGMTALIEGIGVDLPPARMHLRSSISAIEATGEGFKLSTVTRQTFHARRVVIALPPRVALQSINGLASLAPSAAANIPTWMAGQAKAVAIYDRPFWRDFGLSGEAISHRGPLVQIHDASPADGAEGALTGFLGPRPVTEAAIAAQLSALFGEAAARPRAVFIQDWGEEPVTTSDADRASPGQPQAQGAAALHRNDHLIWAGAEAALESTGLVEGALAAAEYAAAKLLG